MKRYKFLFGNIFVVFACWSNIAYYASTLSTHVGGNPVKSSNHGLEESPILPLLSGTEYLDTEQKALLSWRIDTENQTIYFELTAQTKGYIGLGISPNGGMTGADILIAGVYPNGSVYSSDRHGIGNSEPVEDIHQNWVVTFATETETHTEIHFNRLLNTCDPEDMEITDATMRVIWALGDTDTVAYHGANKGAKSINFYMNNENDFNPEIYEKLDITVDMEMPSQKTSYWCSIHRTPVFHEKQHIVAIEPVLENIKAVQHTHHFIFYRCTPPADKTPEEFFDPWVSHSGDHCVTPSNSSFPFLQYCGSSLTYVWSKGGKRLVFPSELGLPMPETLGQREYYAMEIHYDNPEALPGVNFKTGGRMFYSNDLRETEVGILLINQNVQVTLTIPPQSTDFIVNGHCSSECTEKFLPEDGITIFNNLFHAHLAGRKMKLRHFRDGKELPWVDDDEYYDFDFQQNKPLTHYRKVERGDQLTVECTYDTMNAEGGRAVIGGISTRDEMCESTFFYYPRQKLYFCNSRQDVDEHFSLLGMTNYTLLEAPVGSFPEYEILEPEHLAGNYLESVSFKVNWTEEYRKTFQREKRYAYQIGSCYAGNESHHGRVKYPADLEDYIPPDNCKDVTQPPGNTTTPKDCKDCSGSGKSSIDLYLMIVSVNMYLLRWV